MHIVTDLLPILRQFDVELNTCSKHYLVTVLSLEVLNGHHAGHHPDGDASVLVVYPSNREMERGLVSFVQCGPHFDAEIDIISGKYQGPAGRLVIGEMS